MKQNLTLGIHRAGDAYRSVVGALSSVSTESKFVEAGTLTPEEFEQAGDQLTFKFGTWQWEAGDPSRRASYLPAEKQYLVTRNVPCKDRVRALDYVLDHQTRTEDEWLVPGAMSGGGASDAVPDMADLADAGRGEDDADGLGGGPLFTAQDNFIPDFSDLDAQLAEGGDSQVVKAPAEDGDYFVADAPDADIVKTRTYDLSITYDKYYQTPRLWLFGYDEGGVPLGPEQVYEDVLSEYVAKTVTVDPHPLTGTPTVSIHPCKHAQVMKKVVQDWIDQGITPRHDLALFVFLKFISGVVPTINYDFTMDIEF